MACGIGSCSGHGYTDNLESNSGLNSKVTHVLVHALAAEKHGEACFVATKTFMRVVRCATQLNWR